MKLAQNFIITFDQSPRYKQLLEKNPRALFVLQCLVAKAREDYRNRELNLLPGEVIVPTHKYFGMTRQKYRAAMEYLNKNHYIAIVSNPSVRYGFRTTKNCPNPNEYREKCGHNHVQNYSIDPRRQIIKIIDNTVFEVQKLHPSKNKNMRVSRSKTGAITTSYIYKDNKIYLNKETSNYIGAAAQPPSLDSFPSSQKFYSHSCFSRKKTSAKRPTLEMSYLDGSQIPSAIKNHPASFRATLEDLARWSKKYPENDILAALNLTSKQSAPIRNFPAWVNAALKRNWAKASDWISENREYTEKKSVEFCLSELTVTQKYCRDEILGKDFYFNRDPTQFQSDFDRYAQNKLAEALSEAMNNLTETGICGISSMGPVPI